MYSLVIPVYKNEPNLDSLLSALVALNQRLSGNLEVVLVVDGSPDRCYQVLQERLPELPLRSQLLLLSRNFGSFSAVRAGLEAARGDFFAVLAADLQEPPELAENFFLLLSEDRADLVFGTRNRRSDPWLSETASSIFWAMYRRFIVKDMPPGGIDVFGCNRLVRDRLMQLHESHSNLIALLFWMGYRRAYIGYERRPRREGKSSWTVRKKLKYSLDSIFNFTDLPIQVLLYTGTFALILAVVGSIVVAVARLVREIPIPGYTPIVLAILFFGALTSLGLGIIGQYLWLTLQNARGRPNYLVSQLQEHQGPLHAARVPRDTCAEDPVREQPL